MYVAYDQPRSASSLDLIRNDHRPSFPHTARSWLDSPSASILVLPSQTGVSGSSIKMADRRHPSRHSASLKLSTDSIPPQLPLYSPPPRTNAAWNQDPPFADRPPDYPDSSEEADADESDQEVSIHKRRQVSPQIYVSPFHSSPRKTRRFLHPPSPTFTSPRTRHYARSPARQHAATNNNTYLDSLLARSVHALEISNTLLQSSLSTESSMTAVLSTDSPVDDGLEESASGLSKQIMKSKDLQANWIDDLEEIGKRVDSLFSEQTGTEDGPSPRDGQESRIPVEPPDATSPVNQSLPTSSGLPATLAERRRCHHSPPLTVATPTSEGQLNYSAHDRSHFVAPPPRALTVYIGSDDTDPDAIKLPPTLGIRSSPQPTHPHLFQSAASSASSSPTSSNFSNGQSAETRTPELSATIRAYDILSSYVTPQRASNKITRSLSFGSNISPIRQRSHPSPTRSDGSKTSSTPNISSGKSLAPLRAIRPGSPVFPSKPLTPPIEELPSANSSSESDTQTDFAVTSLRKIFMDDQALAIEREKQLSASCMCDLVSDKFWQSHLVHAASTSTSDLRTRPSLQLLAPVILPEASTSHATASVTRLLTKNKHSSSTRPPSPPRHSSLRPPSLRSPTSSPTKNSPGPSPSPSLLNIPNFFGGGSGGSSNGSGRSTPNRVSFAALPESYASSKPGGPDQQFNRERRRKRRKSGSRTPPDARSGSRSLDNDSDERDGWGWWTIWLLSGSNTGAMGWRFDQETRAEERAARWGMGPSPI